MILQNYDSHCDSMLEFLCYFSSDLFFLENAVQLEGLSLLLLESYDMQPWQLGILFFTGNGWLVPQKLN